MASEDQEILAFNRGVISPKGLARIDLKRMAMSSEVQRNWMPRVLGSMMFRPGLEFIDRTDSDDTKAARQLPFVFGVDDTAALELTGSKMRVRINDALITRPDVTAAITDPEFDSPTGVGAFDWQDNSETGGSAVINAGKARISGDRTDFGILQQTVTAVETTTEHALVIDVQSGPVRLRIGSTVGDDDLVAETRLGAGLHSIAFTPNSGLFTIEFANEREFDVLIRSCDLEVDQVMEIATPWQSGDLPFLRWDQSGDVIYLACKDDSATGLEANAIRNMKIERRGEGRSWSVVNFEPENGPFRVQNVSGVTIAPSALSGDITLTSSRPIFKEEHATNGALFRVASNGQNVSKSISGGDDFTSPIRVIGSGAARYFATDISGTFVATITLQFAFTADGPWNDTTQTWTAPTGSPYSYDDGQEDSIIYYRAGVKSGDYTSGTVDIDLIYANGSIQGVARSRNFTNETTMLAQVLSVFGSTEASRDWWEGEWSAYRGYPTSVSLHEGRLWWAGNDKIIGSISDGYESYDDNFEGDGGPISRTIGFGPIRVIHWLISMGRLLFGTSENSANVGAVKMDGNNPIGARSNQFDDPLTPSNFNIKTVGSRSIFVDRSGQRVYELTYNLDAQDYKALDLSLFAPDYNEVGIVQIAVQMKPDVRIHCVRTDGTVGVLIFDRLENVICWVDVDSAGAGGEIEDVSILPGTVEDQVYYIVKRTINGGTQRHLCKWALESEAVGGDLNKMADSFVTYTGVATTTPFTTELLHLRDETVVIWADGVDIGTDVVTAAGALTNDLETAATNVVVGLAYTAQYKSAKLGKITGIGLLDRKKVNRIGFIAQNMHYQGLQYGADFDNLSDLPRVSRGQALPDDHIYDNYHEDNFPFGGTWNEDSRICLQATAPRPCTILAAIAEFESVESTGPRRAVQ